jgi:hypothetical protein
VCVQFEGHVDFEQASDQFDMSWSSLTSNVTAFDGFCSTGVLPHHNFQHDPPFGLDNSCINPNGELYSQSELNPSPETQVVANSAQGMCPRNCLKLSLI